MDPLQIPKFSRRDESIVVQGPGLQEDKVALAGDELAALPAEKAMTAVSEDEQPVGGAVFPISGVALRFSEVIREQAVVVHDERGLRWLHSRKIYKNGRIDYG